MRCDCEFDSDEFVRSFKLPGVYETCYNEAGYITYNKENGNLYKVRTKQYEEVFEAVERFIKEMEL